MIKSDLILDFEALTKIAGYAHWIPVTQGRHKDFFQRNYPGWDWNQIIPALIKNGVLAINSSAPNQRALPQGLSISESVSTLWISALTGEIKTMRG
jgi:hypothetical protein